MDRPVIFGENFFSIAQFPAHVVTAEEEPVGFEAFRAADGRRSVLDYATATTANSDWWLQVTCDRPRTADMVALDRGHNLAGKQIVLQGSDNDGASWADVFNGVLPTVVGPPSIDSGLGVRTEEGAWIKRFPSRAYRAWRLFVPLMGTGLKPQIVGLWLGLSYSPGDLRRPSEPDTDEMAIEESTTPALWAGGGPPGYRRSGSVRLQLTDYFEYELARYHLQYVLGRHRPTWLIHDEGQAERAVLAIRPAGRQGLSNDKGWSYPAGEVNWVEWEPKLEAA